MRKVDLGQELQILAYHEQRKTEDGGAGQHAESARKGKSMSILVVSVSHKSTSVAHLARAGAGRRRPRPSWPTQLVACEHIDEAVVLSTCNRTELYARCPASTAPWTTRPTALADLAGLRRRASCGPMCAVYFDEGAVAHTFARGRRAGLGGGRGEPDPRPGARTR